MDPLPTGPKITGKETILVVDDEAGPRESLRMILKPRYEILTASDGQEALHFIQTKNIEVVTLDLNMRGLSGIEVLREIKRLKPDTEVIITSGYGTLKDAHEAMHLGAADFISKPYNVAEIISIVGKSFERRASNLRIRSLLTGRIQGFRPTGPDVHKNNPVLSKSIWESHLGPKVLEV